MNIVIIPVFNAAVNIPNMSSNETVKLAGSNGSATELKNKLPFSALKSEGAWKQRCRSRGTFRNFTLCTTMFLSVLTGRQRVKDMAGLWF